MAYKFQEGNANFDGEISGSAFRTAGSITGSGDLAVTGNMHAAVFYGSGAGITGISSDVVDVTASSGDRAYPLVFTEGAQTAGTLGLALNTALNYNPNDGLLSSSAGAEFVGASRFVGALGVTGATTLAGKLSSSAGGQFVGNSIFGGTLSVSGATTLAGNLSSSAGLQYVGAALLGSTLGVSGAVSMDGGANLKVKTYTGAASIGTAAIVHVVSGGTAALTMTLPAIGTSGRWYAVKRHNNMSGNVVVDGNASELIDGNTSITLSSAGASVYLVDDGTQWTIL